MGNQRRYVNDNHVQKPKRLLDVAREVLRRKHCSIRTAALYRVKKSNDFSSFFCLFD